jgi:hypothetical protein
VPEPPGWADREAVAQALAAGGMQPGDVARLRETAAQKGRGAPEWLRPDAPARCSRSASGRELGQFCQFPLQGMREPDGQRATAQ